MKAPAINLNQGELSLFDEAIMKEWLVTNGLGGYSASTVLGINTRKYHGLLVAALRPPGYRTVCLSKIDEDVRLNNETFRLGANEFCGTIYPNGHKFLKSFSVSPFPTFVYEFQGATVAKTVFMPKGMNAVVVLYNVLNRAPIELLLDAYPLLTCRYFHQVINRQEKTLEFSQTQTEKEVELTFKEPNVCVKSKAIQGKFNSHPNWVQDLFYREEAARHESCMDDCYQPGFFEFAVPRRRNAQFALVTAEAEDNLAGNVILDKMGSEVADLEASMGRELAVRIENLARFHRSHGQTQLSDWISWALLAADDFVVQYGADKKSVIAGYHWFEPWGRDTFISFPGLFLATERFEEAKRILLLYKDYCRRGLIPNFMEDSSGEPAYNTVDATLWFINAVLQYVKYTGDFQFVKDNLWDRLKDILERHQKGTDFGIHVDSDGLLEHGPRLTWMDAEANYEPVTPRGGRAVEIQALWYNSLRTMQYLSGRFEEKNLAERYESEALKTRTGFNEKFWNKDRNCLYDVLTNLGPDASIRPNQIITAALDFPILDATKAEQVVSLVIDELLTSCGLRTLARDDPSYKGTYSGDRSCRDHAYHNGTVWPWLTGQLTKAYLRIRGNNEASLNYALNNFLMPLLRDQTSRACLGKINEIYDGDPPHTPRGCVSQAWSVAEPLRALLEDVFQIRPKYEQELMKN